ncbi:MAG: protein kinase [Gemmataceae bacterium]
MPIQCPDEERVASWALGDSSDPEVADHIDSCVDCRRQASSLRSMASLFQGYEHRTPSGSEPTLDTPQPAHHEVPRPTMIGKYFVVGELGRGGQAKVYRALHPQLNRDVAIKWSENPTSGEGCEAKLAEEAKLLAQLDDPRILRVYDLDVWLSRPFLVMEYVRGCNLAQWAEQRKIEPLEAARVVGEVAAAAEFAHRVGITHQDIKPHNILIDDQGKPRLADFGIARMRGFWSVAADTLAGGTPAYMAPEQWEGEPNAVNVGADIFALGGVLFFLLTGKHPRSTANTSNPSNPVLQGPNQELLERSSASNAIKAVCRKALAHRPEDRFASAKEMADALAATCTPSSAGTARRRRLSAAACLAAVVLAMFALRSAKETPKDKGISDVEMQRTALANGLALRVLRDGKLETPVSKEDLDRLLPFREKDQLGVEATLPPGMRARVFALDWSAWPKFHVIEPSRTVERDGKAALEGLLPLEQSPDTEVLFVVGALGEAPSLQSIQAALSSLSWNVQRRPQLPGNVILEIGTDRVQGVRGAFGTPQQDDERVLRDGLESMRATLRSRYPLVAGIALPHLPKEAAEAMRRAASKTSFTADDNSVRNPEANSDQNMLDKVVSRLLAVERVRRGYPAKFAWPPLHALSKGIGDANAYATASPQMGAVKDAESGKIRPILIVTEGFMKKIVQGDEHVLAGVLGHELAHLLLDHVSTDHRLDEAIPAALQPRRGNPGGSRRSQSRRRSRIQVPRRHRVCLPHEESPGRFLQFRGAEGVAPVVERSPRPARSRTVRDLEGDQRLPKRRRVSASRAVQSRGKLLPARGR